MLRSFLKYVKKYQTIEELPHFYFMQSLHEQPHVAPRVGDLWVKAKTNHLKHVHGRRKTILLLHRTVNYKVGFQRTEVYPRKFGKKFKCFSATPITFSNVFLTFTRWKLKLQEFKTVVVKPRHIVLVEKLKLSLSNV